MWLSLLDLAFSDKDDIELGEYKLRHIRGLSNSYTNMNEGLIEKSRSHGDIFSTTNKNQTFTGKKSKSFDVTSLQKSATTTTTTNDSANIGLLQGAAISEPFVDRIYSTSIHSDTEPNILDIDNDSIQSLEQDNLMPEEEYSPINQITSPVIKETFKYAFFHRAQLDNDDVYDLEFEDRITNDLPEVISTTNQTYGEEDKESCTSLDSDNEEAAAALTLAVKSRTKQEILEEYRPHSLSTIPSSRESQYGSSLYNSDDDIDRDLNRRTSTISVNQEEYLGSERIENEEEEEIRLDISLPQSRPLSLIQTSSEQNQVRKF
jgi:hypothetical protein